VQVADQGGHGQLSDLRNASAHHFDEFEFPLRLGYADHYYRAPHDLHIRCVIGDALELCVIVHATRRVLGPGS